MSPALTVKDRLDPAAGSVSPPLAVVSAAGVPVLPVAVRMNWSLVAVPPLSLGTLSRASVAVWSSLVMEQVTVAPGG